MFLFEMVSCPSACTYNISAACDSWDRQIGRQMGASHIHRHMWIYRQYNRQIDRWTDVLINKQIDKWLEGQMHAWSETRKQKQIGLEFRCWAWARERQIDREISPLGFRCVRLGSLLRFFGFRMHSLSLGCSACNCKACLRQPLFYKTCGRCLCPLTGSGLSSSIFTWIRFVSLGLS